MHKFYATIAVQIGIPTAGSPREPWQGRCENGITVVFKNDNRATKGGFS
jgi:hypothetical protein